MEWRARANSQLRRIGIGMDEVEWALVWIACGMGVCTLLHAMVLVAWW